MDTTCWHMLTNVATQIEARRAWLDFVSRQIVLDAMPTQQGAHQRVLPVMTSEDATIDLKVPLGFMWWYLTWISLAELSSRIYCASMKLQEHIYRNITWRTQVNMGLFSQCSATFDFVVLRHPALLMRSSSHHCSGWVRKLWSLLQPAVGELQLLPWLSPVIQNLLPVCGYGDMDVPMLISNIRYK